VVQLGATTATPTYSSFMGKLGILWADPRPTGLLYRVEPSGSFTTSVDGRSWSNVTPAAPLNLRALSGAVLGGVVTLWGADDTDNLAAAYPGSPSQWSTLSTGADEPSAVWVGASQSVLVGKNGYIKTAAPTPPLTAFVAVNSPVSSTLSDVTGTSDGKHLWAVGVGGTIVHWDSACGTFIKEDSGTVQDLNALWVQGGTSRVWAVGAQGTLLHRAIP
jgi:hypothetical protein